MPLADKTNTASGAAAGSEERRSQPAVAILLPDCFDDWLIDLQVPVEAFCEQMMGSWVFNYAQALNTAGVRTVLFCISRQVSAPIRSIHRPTGATIHLLPPSRVYRFFRRRRSIDATANRSLPIVRSTNSLRVRASRLLRRLVSTHIDTPLSLLFRELKREGCRSLLVQEYESARFDLSVLMGKLKHVAVFGTFQGGRPQSLVLRPLRRLAMRLCTGLLIPATCEAERVMATYRVPAKKLDLVYSPVDLAVFYPTPQEKARRSLGIPAHAKVVMYHGAITLSYKGLDVLLDAWDRLCHNQFHQDVRLVIIGTGDDAAAFSQLISAKRLRGVEWLNQWVHDRRLIQQYLSSADAYVFPSRGDACPNAVIEAMACGLPIVASDVNGIPDIIDRGERSGGLLIPPGDAGALATALEHVLGDRTLAHELGRCARRRVESAFSMEAIGKQLSGVLLAGRAWGSPPVRSGLHE